MATLSHMPMVKLDWSLRTVLVCVFDSLLHPFVFCIFFCAPSMKFFRCSTHICNTWMYCNYCFCTSFITRFFCNFEWEVFGFFVLPMRSIFLLPHEFFTILSWPFLFLFSVLHAPLNPIKDGVFGVLFGWGGLKVP
jgi:hypothetical protein